MANVRMNRACAILCGALLWVGPAFSSPEETAVSDPAHGTAAGAPAVDASADPHGAAPTTSTDPAHATSADAIQGAVHEGSSTTAPVVGDAGTPSATADPAHAESDPAVHAENSHGEAAHSASEGEHKSPNLFSVDPGLMIWTIVTFLVVLGILRATAWKPLMASMAEREQKIEGAIAEASKIKNEAEQLLAKYQTLLDKAKDESRAILDEARKDGVALQEEIKNRARQEAEEFKARASREIELQKESAIKEIWDQTASISTMLASKVLGRSLESSDQDRLVRELLAGLQSEVKQGGPGGSTGKMS